MTTIITRTVTRIVVPIILVVSVALLLQGHNRPGGGFIAGVLTTTAFALVYIVYGMDFLEEQVLHQRVGNVIEHLQHGIVGDYRALFALGLVLAFVASLAPLAVDDPFLSQYFEIYHVPIYGEFELASAFAFDLGVYLVVVGALLTILSVVGSE